MKFRRHSLVVTVCFASVLGACSSTTKYWVLREVPAVIGNGDILRVEGQAQPNYGDDSVSEIRNGDASFSFREDNQDETKSGAQLVLKRIFKNSELIVSFLGPYFGGKPQAFFSYEHSFILTGGNFAFAGRINLALTNHWDAVLAAGPLTPQGGFLVRVGEQYELWSAKKRLPVELNYDRVGFPSEFVTVEISNKGLYLVAQRNNQWFVVTVRAEHSCRRAEGVRCFVR